MDKAEYMVTMYHCHITCNPEENKCKECEILKIYRKIYVDTRRKEDNMFVVEKGNCLWTDGCFTGN